MFKRLLTAFISVLLCQVCASAAKNAVFSVNVQTEFQHVSGFGGFSPSPTWSYWLGDSDIDKMYGKGENQLGYNIMRLYIGNSEWSWNSAVANAKRAEKYGAYIFASPWSPPASWKDNNSDSNGGHLLESRYADWADFLNRFIAKMKENGVTIDGISLQNEPDWSTSYQSCVWTSEEFIKFLKGYGSRIKAQIICPEDVHFTHSYIDPILNDSDACKELDIVAGHFYGWNGSSYPLAEQKGKEVWMTEYLINDRQEKQGQDINWKDDGFLFAKSVNDAMLANMSAWVHYSLKRYYGCMGDGNYGTVNGQITKRGYILSHFAKYVAGSTRIEHTINSASGVYGSAYRSVTGDSIIFMVINPTQSDFDMTFRLPFESKNGLSVVTDETVNMKKNKLYYAERTSVPVESVPQYSVCTFVFEKATKGEVILDVNGEGRVEGAGSYVYGDTAVIKAIPAEGNRFIGWMADTVVVGSTPILSFPVDNDMQLTAFFSSDNNIYGVALPPVKGARLSGSGIYNEGETFTILAQPSEGYRFISWIDGTGQPIYSNPYSGTVNGSMTFKAVVDINRYLVETPALSLGRVEGTGEYAHGDSAFITAIPDYGYCVSAWEIGDSVVLTEDSILRVCVTAPLTVKPVFTGRQFNITLKSTFGGGAHIKGSLINPDTKYLDTITVVADVSKERYEFTGWYENNSLVCADMEYTFIITGHRTLEARFEQSKIGVTVECGEHGSASLDADKVIYNRFVKLTVQPDEGFEIEKLLMNGTDVTESVVDNSYTVRVKEPVAFTVTFRIATVVQSAPLSGTVKKLYYLNGRECTEPEPEKGIYIEEILYPDGNRKVKKTIIQ
ncbi:MAG: InlB B-repeat-containing protein [Bacteroidaceae bacterium]|nr:InlB B-repeat-containing protein [Bacteroidaceae bacterium]